MVPAAGRTLRMVAVATIGPDTASDTATHESPLRISKVTAHPVASTAGS